MEIEKWLPSLVVLFSVLLYVIRFYTVVFGTWDISQKHEKTEISSVCPITLGV